MPTEDNAGPARPHLRVVSGEGTRRRHRCRGLRRPWPGSVWPCAGPDHDSDRHVISGWLARAITRIVTTYTRRGDRVLLLATSDSAAGRDEPSTCPDRGRGAFPGPTDAAPVVARLGRSVRSGPAAPTEAGPGTEPGPGSESGSGPRPDKPDLRESGLKPESGQVADQTAPSPRYHLIITTVDPAAVHTFQPDNWVDRLHPSGALAVITHSDSEQGRLLDPTGPVVRAADRVGLRFRDHIVVLDRPLRDVCPRPGIPPTETESGECLAGRGHADLLVFDLAPAAFAHTSEPETSNE